MKQVSTIVLKGAILFLGLIVLTLCLVVLPRGIVSDEAGYYRPILAGMYLTAVPFFFALLQAFRLLRYIDTHKIFSEASVKALQSIKYSAFLVGVLYMAGLPVIYYAADRDDAPGVMALGCVIMGIAFVVAAAMDVLQRIIQRALEIKSENDLTV